MLVMIWNCYYDIVTAGVSSKGKVVFPYFGLVMGGGPLVEFKGCFNGNKHRESWRNAVNIQKMKQVTKERSYTGIGLE